MLHRLIRLIAVLALCLAPCTARAQPPTHVLLRTDVLLPPLVLPDTPEDRAITALTVQVTFDHADEGRGFLTFEVGTPTVNAFGDVLQGPITVLPALAITAHPLLDDPITPRRLYSLRLADGRFPDQFALVRGLTPGAPHRLLLRQGALPGRLEHTRSPLLGVDWGIVQVLPLHDLTTTAGPRDTTPRPPTLHWATLLRGQDRVIVCGTLGGPALLHRDPNRFNFNAFGDVRGSTQMFRPPQPATLRLLPDLDPTGQGRRLFEAVLTPPPLQAGASRDAPERVRASRALFEEQAHQVRYILVVAPTTTGPHRLLIWEHGRVQQLRHDPQQGYRGTQYGYAPDARIEGYEAFRLPPPCATAPEGQH